jgi:N-acetylneuraminate synthase
MVNEPLWAEVAIFSDDIAALVYQWRSDPMVRQSSLHTTLPDFQTFRRNFRFEYGSCPDLQPFFLRTAEERVAFIRFRPYDGADIRPFVHSAEVSIIVPHAKRRQGFGLRALQTAADLARQAQVHTLFALIRPDNEASKRLFARAGYAHVGKRTIQVETLEGREQVEVLVYSQVIIPEPIRKSVYLVAEVGSNWQVGSKVERHKLAANLVEEAALAGFNAVKFQTFRAGRVYAPSAGKSTYLAQHGTDKDIHELFKGLEMAYEEIPILADMAKRCGLDFMSTPFSTDDFDAVNPYVAAHKIASYEIAHEALLMKAAVSRKPVFVSTGGSFPEEIAFALSILRQAGCTDITLLQCTAAYPAPPTAMNLRAIRTLAQTFSVPVGLSDHSLDCITAPLLAVAYGASVIEKHVTMSRSLPVPDSFFSIEPSEMRLFVEKVRLAEKMVGTGQKGVLSEEEELFWFAKRAIQAIRPIEKGERLKDGENVAILRPGTNRKGAHPALYPSLCGHVVSRAIAAGEGIQRGDVE